MRKNSDVILCADSESLTHPELLGLDGESLDSSEWLTVVSDAGSARSLVGGAKGQVEVWVAGSDQMEAINLAAALKHDRPDANISIVDFNANGSLISRAGAAGLGDVMDRAAFTGRYRTAKSRFSLFGRARSSGMTAGPSFQGSVGQGSPTLSSAEQADGLLPQRKPEDEGKVVQDAFAGIRPGPLMPSGMPLVQSSTLLDTGVPFAPANGVAAAPSSIRAHAQEAYLLTVVGAGGGTGKSSIAALCSCYAKRLGKRTLLLDADLQFGDLPFLMGNEAPMRADELLGSPLRVEGLVSVEGMPALLAAPSRLERSEFVSARFKDLLALVRPRFDVIVANTGASWSDVHMRLLEESSNVLFLLDQRPSSIRACRHALELCASCGIASQRFLFAMNRCSRKALFSGSDASTALQGARVFELLDGGIAVEEQLGCGNPMALFDSGNALAQSIEALMDEVLPRSHDDAAPVVDAKSKKRRWGWKRRRP